ncbi:hypothetical protein ACS127_10200 [Amphibacillus sp. Q70]|uniref:hypothetical protein n=1 Tax=Amphibacillus sp. Q70 TaxID=3453416 RepID=UPI003F84266C
MVKGFSSEELKNTVIETISDSGDSNYQRSFDVIWPRVEILLSDDYSNDEKKVALNVILQLYAQMISMETVNITLNTLIKTGTLVPDEDFKI